MDMELVCFKIISSVDLCPLLPKASPTTLPSNLKKPVNVEYFVILGS